MTIEYSFTDALALALGAQEPQETPLPPFRALLDAFPGRIQQAEEACDVTALAALREETDNLAQMVFDLDCEIDAPCGIPTSQLSNYYDEFYVLRLRLTRSLLDAAHSLRVAPNRLFHPAISHQGGYRTTLAECRAIADAVCIGDASRDLLTLVEFVLACTPEED